MKKKVTPIFLISLPRTGSTLLQRILMSHSKIASVAEPHFLLPLVYSSKKTGTITNYSHLASYQGIVDMMKILPNGKKDYNKCIRDFATYLYSSLSDSKSVYFLDKTPRYFWILPELSTIFPEAKFIFLFRNPIQIYGSILNTFSNSNFNRLYEFNKTLTHGFELLSKGYDELKNRSFSLQYEEFISNPQESLKEIFNYLQLDYEDSVLCEFTKQELKGGSKDPTGIKLYNSISQSPTHKWESVFNTAFRKKVLLTYVANLSDHSLEMQGYNKIEIIKTIKGLGTDGRYNAMKDIFDIKKTRLIEKFNLNLYFAENMEWAKEYYLC